MNRHLVALALMGALVACSRGEPARSGESHDAHGPAGGAAELRVPDDLRRKWGVVVAPVVQVESSSTIALPGIVAVNQQRTAHVSSLLEGKIVALRTDLGDRVRRNQVLAIVHSPAFAAAKSAFLQAYARWILARQESDRAKTLFQQEALQQKEYQRRQAELESASTEYGMTESNLHSFGLDQAQVDALVDRYRRLSGGGSPDELAAPDLSVLSPLDGQIIFRDVIVGEHVPADKTLFTVSDLSTLWALLDAREADLPHMRAGGAVTVRSQVYRDRSFAGRILHVGDVVDDKLRTIKVRVEVSNADGLLKPNMYIQGIVQTRSGSRAVMAVPDEAVQTIGGEPAVFVLEAGDRFVVRPVELGEKIGTNRAIIRGLTGSEQVAVAGAFTLKSELMKGSLGEGH